MKRKATASEAQEQIAVCQWWRSYCRTVGLDECLLMAIPNGSVLAGDARRRAMQMHKLKATGLRVGAPDLMLATKRMLFIEMKAVGGKASESQCVMAMVLTGQGHECRMCNGAQQAIDAIKFHITTAS